MTGRVPEDAPGRVVEPTTRRVLVTGAASGLGAALTAAFRARGDQVLATDLDERGLDELDHRMRLDITSDEDWAAALARVESEWGGLDVLVNNAGVAGGGRLDVATMDEWQWITEINLFGAVRGTRTFVPMFKRQRSGQIVNVASLAGLVHPAGMASYNAVKAAVVALTETTGHELAAYGVRASVVCPSYFRTNLMSSLRGADEALAGGDGAARRELPARRRRHRRRRPGRPRPGRRADRPGPARPRRLRAQAARPRGVRRGDARAGRQAGAGLDRSTGPGAGSAVSTTTEEARPVREEDAFDVEAVAAWLRENATLPEGWQADDLAGTPEVRQFPGGASNLTYLLRYPKRDLILRRPPAGVKAASAHDMGREFRIQSALAPVFPYVATMLGFCRDESVIGSDFYVMEKLDGTILRRELPWPMSEEQVSQLCSNAFDVLIALHSVDVRSSPELARLGRGEGYVARQVSGWIDRFGRARTDDTGDWSDIIAWIEAHQPQDVGQCLIHNDFRFDNMVLSTDDPMRIIGVLDWEMATVGDPLMDLGGALSYWVEAGDDEFFQAFRRQPTTAPGMWTRQQIVERYCERMGFTITPEQWRFYEVFGLFRLAVIAQQIWYRYFHQQTTNEAYAVFGPAVGYLEARCRGLVSTGSTGTGSTSEGSTSEGSGSTSEGSTGGAA